LLARISAGDNQKIIVLARLYRRLNPRHGGVAADGFAPGNMPAKFRHLLVFNLNATGTGRLIGLHGSGDIVKTGIGIGNERGGDGRANRGNAVAHIGAGQKAIIGFGQLAGRHAIAREIKGIKAHSIGNARRQPVINAGGDNGLCGEFLTKRGAVGRHQKILSRRLSIFCRVTPALCALMINPYQ
jgi:hypothetical protein